MLTTQLILSTALVVAVSLSGGPSAAGFVTPQKMGRPLCSQSIDRGCSASWSKRKDFWQTTLQMSASDDEGNENKLPFFLDPGTKGGAIFLSIVAFVVPILFYQFVTNVFGVDGVDAGIWIGGGFTVFATLAWVSSYIFRVATKDMTYAKQLKDYENAVIAKRLEELDEDELQALVEEVERDEF